MKKLHQNYNLRNNPLCPFGNLKWNKYYWVRPVKKLPEYELDYWGDAVDPDGKTRNLLNEWGDHVKKMGPVVNLLKNIKPGILLDVGCGPGFLLSSVDDKWDKYGVDVSKTALETCSRYAKTIRGELTKIKFKQKFDVVVLNHVIEHLVNPLAYMRKVKQILKKEGYLIVGTPDFDSACARRFGVNYRMLHDPGHTSLFTSFSLVKMLEDLKFTVLQVEYPFFETRYFSKENLERLFNKDQISPPFYGNHILVLAKK